MPIDQSPSLATYHQPVDRQNPVSEHAIDHQQSIDRYNPDNDFRVPISGLLSLAEIKDIPSHQTPASPSENLKAFYTALELFINSHTTLSQAFLMSAQKGLTLFCQALWSQMKASDQISDLNGQCAEGIRLAFDNGHTDIQEFLFKNITPKSYADLLASARAGRLARVQDLLANQPPTLEAGINDNQVLVEVITQGGELSKKDLSEYDQSSDHQGILDLYHQLYELLLTDPSVQHHLKFQECFYAACESNNLRVATELLNTQKIDIFAEDKRALWSSVWNDSPDTVALILEQPGMLEQLSNDDIKQLLTFASENKSIACLKALLSLEHIEFENNGIIDGYTALFVETSGSTQGFPTATVLLEDSALKRALLDIPQLFQHISNQILPFNVIIHGSAASLEKLIDRNDSCLEEYNGIEPLLSFLDPKIQKADPISRQEHAKECLEKILLLQKCNPQLITAEAMEQYTLFASVLSDNLAATRKILEKLGIDTTEASETELQAVVKQLKVTKLEELSNLFSVIANQSNDSEADLSEQNSEASLSSRAQNLLERRYYGNKERFVKSQIQYGDLKLAKVFLPELEDHYPFSRLLEAALDRRDDTPKEAIATVLEDPRVMSSLLNDKVALMKLAQYPLFRESKGFKTLLKNNHESALTRSAWVLKQSSSLHQLPNSLQSRILYFALGNQLFPISRPEQRPHLVNTMLHRILKKQAQETPALPTSRQAAH